MKKHKNILILLGVFINALFFSCAAIGDIFKAGFNFGIFVVIAIIVLVLILVFQFNKKS